jgi:hypothetical protein
MQSKSKKQLKTRRSEFLSDVEPPLTLCRYKRILVFLTTHSTPDTHLLWHTPEGEGASTVAEVSNLSL